MSEEGAETKIEFGLFVVWTDDDNPSLDDFVLGGTYSTEFSAYNAAERQERDNEVLKRHGYPTCHTWVRSREITYGEWADY